VVARSAHDVGLAVWFGGELLGAIALNGASMEVDDPNQRARVADAGWMRMAPVVTGAVGLHLLGTAALVAGGELASPFGRDPLARARAALTLAAMGTTAWSGLLGRRVVAAGDVPAASSVRPTSETPPDVAAAMRRLRVVQWVIPVLSGAIFLVHAAQVAGAGSRLARRRRRI
jgi:hypothetical protein